jgi:hypothetical protein
MKKLGITFIYFCLVLALGYIGCEKGTKGCLDIYATNYNPQANLDDQSCLYLSDLIIGTYQAKDTSVRKAAAGGGGGNGATTYAQYPFSITRIDNADVSLNGFGQCTTVTSAEVTNGQIIIASFDCKTAYNSVILYISEDKKKITYSYSYPGTAQGGGGGAIVTTVSGIAIKQ